MHSTFESAGPYPGFVSNIMLYAMLNEHEHLFQHRQLQTIAVADLHIRQVTHRIKRLIPLRAIILPFALHTGTLPHCFLRSAG